MRYDGGDCNIGDGNVDVDGDGDGDGDGFISCYIDNSVAVQQAGPSQQQVVKAARVDPAACQLHYEEFAAEVPSNKSFCFLFKPDLVPVLT